MFRQWETAIDTLLRAGENILTINFTSPLIKSKQLANASSIVLPVEERVYTRKAQYHYGWDWGLDLLHPEFGYRCICNLKMMFQ